MTKDDFYLGKTIAATEWWLHECDLPALRWARLRLFSDGSADVCWEEGGILCGFDRRDFATYFLCEDEYRSLATMDAADEREFGFELTELVPPSWTDPPGQSFEYVGTY
jgi:hypothetical protein